MNTKPSKPSWKRGWVAALIAAIFLGGFSAYAQSAGGYLYYFPVVFRQPTPTPIPTPNSMVVTRNQSAFDTCHLPDLSKLQIWWNSSPYRIMGLYLGGSSFPSGCDYSGLNIAWLQQADKQGWTFIPTWSGPQAPCSGARSVISSNTGTAYTQGRQEADAAIAKAAALDFSPTDLIIYLDVEAYAQYNDGSNSCRNAVNSYVSGWVSRMHERGNKAGVYGGSSSSYMADWASIANVPDDVWIAEWNQVWAFDPNASVFGLKYLSNSYWSNHQRIHQYAGDHKENWGGTTLGLNIDSDIADGAVLAFGPGGLLSDMSVAGAPALQAAPPEILDAQLLDANQGWALRAEQLLWTADGGATWKDLTPPAAGGSALLSADFLDAGHGWLAIQSSSDGGLSVLATTDGGASWQSAPLPLSADLVGRVSLDFIDAQNGWAAVQFPSSSIFSQGTLFRTSDGGQTWTQLSLPIGDPVRFVDAQHGWVAGGAGGNELYATQDGGSTWHLLSVVSSDEDVPGQVYYGLPEFSSPSEGLLPVTISDPAQPHLELYATHDGGQTWGLASITPLNPQDLPGGALPLDVSASGNGLAALPDGASIRIAAAGATLSAQASSPVPAGVTQMELAASGSGWVVTWNGVCTGDKLAPDFSCTQRSQLFKTTDGGQTWVEITP